jgi:radical SAM protein with 4Fe4S-binding SPASM domain
MSAVDEIYDHGGFIIKITGGEPFLRPDIFDILYYIDSKPINTIVYSNGLLIDNNAVNKLKQLKYSRVRISIDGARDTNDKIRGKGSFDVAYSALKKLLHCGVDCEINYTVNYMNYLEIEVLSSILKKDKMNCKIHLNTIKIAGNAINNNDLIIPRKKIEYVFNEVEKQINNDIQISPDKPFTDSYLKIFGDIFGCPSGRMILSICSNGDVSGCGLLYNDSSLLCGNIVESKISTLWESDSINFVRRLPERKECVECVVYRNNCTGGCRGNALNKFGDLCGDDVNCNIFNLKSAALFAFDCL